MKTTKPAKAVKKLTLIEKMNKLVNPKHLAKLANDLPNNYKLRAIKSDDEWAKLTKEGSEMYVVIAQGAYMLIGTKDGVPNKLLSSAGTISKSDESIYKDTEHNVSLMARVYSGKEA